MSLIWKIRRLASMQPLEIPFRVHEWWKTKTEHDFSPPSLPESFLSRDLPKWPVSSIDIDEQTLRDAEQIQKKGLSLLGIHWSREKLWCWNNDPETNDSWPEISPHQLQLRFSEKDIKLTWELQKLQHLQILAWAAYHGDVSARDLCLEGLESWLSYDQPYRGIAYASGIECACRLMSFLWISWALGDSIQPSLRRRIWHALYHHACWIQRYPSLYSSANNHRIAEISSLLVLASLVPDLPCVQSEPLEEELLSLLPRQQYIDGVSTEQSIAYQALCMEWLLYVQHVAIRSRERVHDFLRRGSRFLVSILDEKGNAPKIGDLDNCSILRFAISYQGYICSVCGAAAHVVGDPYGIPSSYRSDLRLRLLGKNPLKSKHIPQSVHFPKGGYTILRYQSIHVVMDHGPLGFDSTGGHGHSDALAVWMHRDGIPIWIDWGMYRYNGKDCLRSFARSTYAHNTVVLNGVSQSIMSGPFNWSRRASCFVNTVRLYENQISAEHDGYSNRHRRRVWLKGEDIEIEDHILGDWDGTVEVCFWLAGHLTAIPCHNGWIITDKDGEIATFLLKDSRFIQTKQDMQVHGFAYNQCAPATGLIWKATGVQQWKITWEWKKEI